MAFAGFAAFFFEKMARVFTVAAPEGVGADRAGPLKLRELPSISEMPRDAGEVAADIEAISSPAEEETRSFAGEGGKNINFQVQGQK